MRLIRSGLTGPFILAAMAAISLAPTSAMAVTDSDTLNVVAATDARTVSTTGTDDLCVQARQTTGEDGPCAQTTTYSVSSATAATSAQLATDSTLTASDGTALTTAASKYTIYTRTWYQQQRGLYYVNWWEKHNGRIYYDNHGHVWSTTETYGMKGYHHCGLGGGIGYSVKVTNCSVEKRYDLSRPAISQWDYYQVHVVAKGIPIYASHHMHSNAYDNGTITFP